MDLNWRLYRNYIKLDLGPACNFLQAGFSAARHIKEHSRTSIFSPFLLKRVFSHGIISLVAVIDYGRKKQQEKSNKRMNYMICIPSPQMVSRENCERIHNILARMSETYKLKIVPEQVKTKMSQTPDYYKKYRIYKEIKERDGNGEAYLLQEEEDMILSVCRNPEEVELMKSCTYAYQYPANLVLKSFREEMRERR